MNHCEVERKMSSFLDTALEGWVLSYLRRKLLICYEKKEMFFVPPYILYSLFCFFVLSSTNHKLFSYSSGYPTPWNE